MNIELDLKKSLAENANEYYRKSKQSKRKITGAKKALENTGQKLKSSEKNEDDETPMIRRKVTLKWYEKFRWFISSNGFLVVGGKDATSNEALIKKHTDAQDIVFHAEIVGAPFFVVKNKQKVEIPESTLSETAQAAASYSRAWRSGMGSCDVYCVEPQQLSKTPQSGEYLTKGAFVIRGERRWYKNVPLELCIGYMRDNDKTVGGPASIATQMDTFVILKQGDKKSSDIAGDIRTYFKSKTGVNIQVDDIQRCMPAGGSIISREK